MRHCLMAAASMLADGPERLPVDATSAVSRRGVLHVCRTTETANSRQHQRRHSHSAPRPRRSRSRVARGTPLATAALKGREKWGHGEHLEANGEGVAAQAGSAPPNPACCSAGVV